MITYFQGKVKGNKKALCILNTRYRGFIRWRQFPALEDIGKNLTDLATKTW
jgi:hypothetical protein